MILFDKIFSDLGFEIIENQKIYRKEDDYWWIFIKILEGNKCQISYRFYSAYYMQFDKKVSSDQITIKYIGDLPEMNQIVEFLNETCKGSNKFVNV